MCQGREWYGKSFIFCEAKKTVLLKLYLLSYVA